MEVNFRHIDETYIQIEADRGLLAEIRDNFTFYPPNFQFHPKYKAGYWDGKIYLIDRNGRVYKGLLKQIATFLEDRGIDYGIDDKVFAKLDDVELTEEKVLSLFKAIGGPFTPHDSQVAAVKYSINESRSIILAPTSNGKSYAIHGITSYHVLRKRKVLVMVDRTNLVTQLKANLSDEYFGHKLFRSETVYDFPNPSSNVDVFFTTWQSVYKNPEQWFKQFDVLIADEVHKFKADSLKTIMEKCGHIAFRHGFTATLDNDSKSDRSTLIGMFGEPLRVTTNKEQIEAGIAAKPIITMIILDYKDPIHKKTVAKLDFNGECEYIEKLDIRNQFIKQLASKLGGVSLIAFKHHDHGVLIRDLIEEDHAAIYFADSTVSAKKRDKIIDALKEAEEAMGVVSIGTFSTGLNIPNLNNLIIACQIKSAITVPQLIGRMLRRGGGKTHSFIYDIGDNLTHGERENFTLKHFKDRVEMYRKEGFEIKVKKITL